MKNASRDDNESDAFTLYDLARLWDVSYTTVWELARRDELPVPVIRVGRRYLVSRAAYNELMTAQHEPQAQSA